MAEEELKLHEQDDGSIIVGEDDKKVDDDHADHEDDDKPVSNDTNDEEDGHPEETDQEAEERRERNRKRRTENKERRKEYVESLKRELAARDAVINDLVTRVSSVERTATSSQIVQLDNAISEAEAQYKELQEINRKAIEQANGEVAVAAQDRMFAIRNRYSQLVDIKKNMGRQAAQPTALDPRVKKNGDAWHEKNRWFNPSGDDMDSRIALTIDAQLANEGWSPSTTEFWDELDSRIKKYLPHRSGMGYSEKKTRQSSSPVSGGRESTGTAGATYKLSKARVDALMDAGIWDDPVKRADAIKRYQQLDKENGSK